MAINPLATTVQLAKALGHPARLRILALLHRGPFPVCQITSVLHSVASTVSGHLLDLRRSGLVVEERQGKFVYYRLTDDPAITTLLAAVFSSLEADAQIREDAALGHRVRATSLLACEALTQLPEDTGGPHAEVGPGPATTGAART